MNLFGENSNRSGAALLTVLIAMMIIMLILFEFQYSAMVERQIAYNDLNRIQAHYLAKSGARIGLLRVALYGRLANSPQLQSITKQMGDITAQLDKIWNLPLPEFPPAQEEIKELDFKEKVEAEEALEQTMITNGRTSHVITTESSKINLNYLLVPEQFRDQPPDFRAEPERLDQYVGLMLLNLFEKFIQEADKPYDEYPSLVRPEEQVMDIMDWVTPGDVRFAGGSKDSFYERLDPPYKAKRNRFYTVEELKLVKGIDEKLFQKMRPHITVYSYDGRININSASREMYKLLYRDFNDDDLKRIMEKRDELGGWASEKQFVDYVSDELGQSGFKEFYKEESEYPFTVASESFIIEARGAIQKSASVVQTYIKVAAALTTGQGGQTLTGVSDEATCRKTDATTFWDKRFNQCRTRPKNGDDCRNVLAGTWLEQNGKNVCKLNVDNQQGPPLFVSPPAVKKGERPKPNALKVLYWSEA